MDAPAGDPGPQERRDEALAALYDRFGPALFRAARTLLGDDGLAEDAVQDTFLGLIRSAVPLADLDNARAYLFAALRHAVAKLRARGRAALPLGMDAIAEAEPRPPDLDRAVRLERALAELPADQREVIALKVDGGLTFAEVAACLGVSPNTAASRYRYALEKLRAALGGSGHDP
jgi:RNA polymerase sigma-70 factor (ECF subfamily)